MQADHYRKVELQSPADLNYLYTNTVALSRQKLDLHFPPSANGDSNNPDPMKERVKELVDEFITQTFTHASDSISINGLDFRASATTDSASDKSNPFLFPSAFSAPETVEYEQYDTALASRVTSLYAQLESLTTTVAQLRRDVPGKAARAYADALAKALDEDDADSELLDQQQQTPKPHSVDQDVEMTDDSVPKTEDDAERTTAGASSSLHVKTEWKLKIPFGTDTERERWLNGEMAEIYSDTLRTLLRLQGEYVDGDKEASTDAARKALATSMGMAERAGRAAEVVEKM